jgi:hypothetical protein
MMLLPLGLLAASIVVRLELKVDVPSAVAASILEETRAAIGRQTGLLCRVEGGEGECGPGCRGALLATPGDQLVLLSLLGAQTKNRISIARYDRPKDEPHRAETDVLKSAALTKPIEALVRELYPKRGAVVPLDASAPVAPSSTERSSRWVDAHPWVLAAGAVLLSGAVGIRLGADAQRARIQSDGYDGADRTRLLSVADEQSLTSNLLLISSIAALAGGGVMLALSRWTD